VAFLPAELLVLLEMY